MITISATKFREQLFEYLGKVSAGETIVIQRNHQIIARLIPGKQMNWRDAINPLTLKVAPDELLQPLAASGVRVSQT